MSNITVDPKDILDGPDKGALLKSLSDGTEVTFQTCDQSFTGRIESLDIADLNRKCFNFSIEDKEGAIMIGGYDSSIRSGRFEHNID